jgi:hypothetical protein
MDILDASGIWISGAVVAAPSTTEIGGDFFPMFWIAGIEIGAVPEAVAGGDYIPTWRPRRR